MNTTTAYVYGYVSAIGEAPMAPDLATAMRPCDYCGNCSRERDRRGSCIACGAPRDEIVSLPEPFATASTITVRRRRI
jgi:hypothetical protein